MSAIALILFLYFKSYSQGQDTSKIGNQIFNSGETEPAFPGGDEKFKDYITLHLHNTEMAVGRIVVQFVVEVDGTLSDIHVVKGLCCQDASRQYGASTSLIATYTLLSCV